METRINSHFLQLIKNVVENRKISLFDEENKLIFEHNLITGVPQGSTSSPTLFNITMPAVHKTVERD